MKWFVVFCIAAVAMLAFLDRPTTPVEKVAASEQAPAPAESQQISPDKDTTMVTNCEDLPHSVSIEVMSWSETSKACREMMRVMEGVRNKDITMFEKVAVLIKFSGYEKDKIQILNELVEIIRLRGLYDKPDRWYGTIDVIWRSWSAFNGAVSPADVISLLRGAGGAAKTISDSGLTTAIIMMKQQHQRGE
jgi:hypothetical protein